MGYGFCTNAIIHHVLIQNIFLALDNVKDMMRKGKGVALANRKLTQANANMVKRLYNKEKGRTLKVLAEMFGVSTTAIRNIIITKTYKGKS